MKEITKYYSYRITKLEVLPELSQLNNGVFARSMILALIIGSVLTLVNQFNALFGSYSLDILPLILVYITPFIVITISQFTGIRQAWTDGKEGYIPMIQEHFVSTALSHRIPTRAVTIGLIIGVINSIIILIVLFLGTGAIGSAPIAFLGQTFALPILFGFLSQSIAYRRTSKLIVEYMRR